MFKNPTINLCSQKTLKLSYGTLNVYIGGWYFENRLCKSFNWITKFEFTGGSIKCIWLRKDINDHISGSKSKRPGLDKAIEYARSGDTIVVWRLDRLGRNMEDLITLVNELNERGVSFHSLEENITMDKSSSTGQLLFHLFAAFAEFERNLIL